MPQRNKREHKSIVHDGTERGHPRARAGTTKGDVDVADEPTIIASVPGTPEGDAARRVGYASQHILGRVNAINQSPQTEEAPWDEEFKPYHVQVEVREERDLGGSVVGPVGVALGYCYAVVVM